jgi:hypothetical protein
MTNIYFIILALIAFIYIIHEIRKRKFSIKESFWWVVAAIVMLFLAIFPYSINNLAKFLNIDYPPSLLFVLCIVFLVFINFKNSKKIAEQQEKIIELAQELAIIKARIKNEKK